MWATQDVGLGYERNRWAAQLGPLFRLWESLTPSFSSITQLALPKTAASSSLDEFLVSEVVFAQQLVATVAGSLGSLSDLVLASGVLTPTLQVRSRRQSVYSAQTHWSSCIACTDRHGARKKVLLAKQLGGFLPNSQGHTQGLVFWYATGDAVTYDPAKHMTVHGIACL